MPLRTGDELLNGKYRIVKHIGKGGFGSVYLAHDTLLGRQVAIKELLTEMVDDPTLVKRFVAEARVAIDLRHPNIVEVYDVFPEGGNYYIAMEYLPGGSLQDRLRAKGQLTVDEALRIMAQVCAGLDHAHRKGVVHCDVKPANILFTGGATAKVADFGIAHISSDLMTRVWRTATQFTAGTMQYMSPEQLEGLRDDPKVDVHALGAVLYEMLAGKPYLDFETESTPAAQMRNFQRIAHEAPRPLPSRVPPWLGAVVAKALAKRPDSRYADAGALGAALQALDPLMIRAEHPTGPAETPTTRRRPTPEPAPLRPVRPRRKVKGIPVWFWPAVGCGGAVLAMLLIVVGFAVLLPERVIPGAVAPTHTPTATIQPTATWTYTPSATPTNTAAPTATPVPSPTRPAVADVLRQWAMGAVASSEYSYPEWSAQQATGAPNTLECGDIETAWASETSEGVEWLEVTFATAVIPTGINIRETYSPGFIKKVDVKDEAGLYYTIWEGTPGAVEECPRVLSIPISGLNARVNAVRINMDQREGGYWNEIDAVELVGQP